MVFVNQKKHSRNGTWDNNCHVKDNMDAAMHQFHAFMSTYAYGQTETVDFASCSVETETGLIVKSEIYDRLTVEE